MTYWRMLLMGAFQDGWLLADQEEKDRIFAHWIEMQKNWSKHGCRYVCAVDNELLLVGEAPAGNWNFFEVWEIPEPSVAKDLLDYFRYPKDGGPRLDRYFRFQAVIGNPIESIDETLALPA